MRQWPHAPARRLEENGAYMVMAGTYRKHRFFDSTERLELLHDALLQLAEGAGWELQAWAVMSNHYHFVGIRQDDAHSLKKFLGKLHMITAKAVNRLDATPGRKVWFQYWDTQITYENSYLARLQYVHTNPVHHGIVPVSTQYPWCSAR